MARNLKEKVHQFTRGAELNMGYMYFQWMNTQKPELQPTLYPAGGKEYTKFLGLAGIKMLVLANRFRADMHTSVRMSGDNPVV